ncbi:glycosyltransferase [Prosthecomicrobium hirschii]|uniref:glycosyltransferase n=1 Tax=Prosthecodimorpha hirschii TaxID=665126 RepID=UPI00221F8032|nr:glycosyltransferase [Prosthecomicrobium hirschii]MCW1839872.1 glycosyltransferase [Prosthecomicrobium hirschii]
MVSRTDMADGKSLRIVHCLRAPVGGVFRHVEDLVRHQAAAGHAVGLVCAAGSATGHEAQRLDDLAGDLALGVHRVPMGRSIGPRDLLAAARLWRRLSPLRPDILHGHGAKGGTFARLVGQALRAGGIPVARLYSPHGGSLHFAPASLEGRVYFAVERALERLTESLVFVSRFEEAAYRAKVGAPRCRSSLIYNGVSAAEFAPVAADPDAADFVCVGEMRDLKGTDLVIEAVARLRAAGRPVTAALIGPGTERDRYEALARERGLLGVVTFGESRPIRRALARGRTVLVPSRAESLPYVVLETIAAARPLIATAVGGIPEIFAAEAGRLIAPGAVEPLADAMAAALDDPTGHQDRAVRLAAAIRPTFSSAAMAGSMEALYRSLVAQRTATVPDPTSSLPVTSRNR